MTATANLFREYILAFIIGPTNVGKSKLITDVVAAGPDVGAVEVGKMMRAKYMDPASPHYDPDHFKGQAAPTHTEKEAWQMMLDGIVACREAGKRLILIDGQPRRHSQCAKIIAMQDRKVFINLYAPEEVRTARAQKRDAADPAKLALSLSRMKGDIPDLYEVLCLLSDYRQPVRTFYEGGTTGPQAATYLMAVAKCLASGSDLIL